MADSISENLENVAKGPRAVETDGLRVNQHSIPDLIEADRYERSKANQEKNRLPVRHVQIRNTGPAY